MPLLHRSTSGRPAASLDPVRIATGELELAGFVAPTGQRITDMLLRGQDLAFLPNGAEPTPHAWIMVAPADILWVVPPPLPSRPGWRPSQAEGRLFVRIGDYRIIGSAHIPPETPMDHRLRERHPFLPLTGASISRDRALSPEDLPVVIVNLTRAVEHRGFG